jgi:phage-related tail protein
VLIALLTILLLGGGATSVLQYIDDTQDAVKIVIPKGEERKAALSTLKAMKKRTTALNKAAKQTAKEIDKAFGDHDTTAADLDDIWDGYFAAVDKHNHDMLDLRFQLKESVSREEWQQVFGGE